VETIDNAQKLKQARMIFWLNFLLLVFALAVFIKSLAGNEVWKMISSGVGFTLIFGLTVMLFLRIVQLKKQANN
jgi:hypothetical protein